MTPSLENPPQSLADDLLVGVRAISRWRGTNDRQTYWACETGQLPAFRHAGKWCMRKSRCVEFLRELEDEAIARGRAKRDAKVNGGSHSAVDGPTKPIGGGLQQRVAQNPSTHGQPFKPHSKPRGRPPRAHMLPVEAADSPPEDTP
jgi:hypothetical protein